MNKKLITRALLLLASLFAVGLTACTDDKTESTITLHYQMISDIGPSMVYTSSAPSYKGAAPSAFAIDHTVLDGKAFDDQTPSFTINETTGSISITNTEMLLPGLYSLTVSCKADGRRNVFADVFQVRMLPATPENIVVTPNLIEVEYEKVKDPQTPTAQIETLDETVTLNAYAIEQEAGKEYFAVSETGVISINKKFTGEILPGVYTPTLVLSSKAGTARYEDQLTIKVMSKPLGVTYERNPGRAEAGYAFSGSVAELYGSPEEVVYSIVSVTPATDQFTINPATGVVSTAAQNTLTVGTTHAFTLKVVNKYGEAELADAYQVEVVDFIEPIDPATFVYADATLTEACALTIQKTAGFVGDDALFSLGELDAALKGQLSIDKNTGEITIAKGNKIPLKETPYTVTVVATNPKSDAENPTTTTFNLAVEANPNMFHKFGYGNNLDLDAESNADQFLYYVTESTADIDVIIPVGYQDFPAGLPVKYKLETLHNWMSKSASIVPETGELKIKVRLDRAGQVGYYRVTATVGEGATAVSRSTVVFLTASPKDARLIYKPFVHRINPKNGGLSGIPVQFIGNSLDMSRLKMALKGNPYYIDFLAPGSKPVRIDTADATETTYIFRMWKLYSDAAGIVGVNKASNEPFTYYGADGNVSALLSKKNGYVDPTNGYQMYIAPGKWMLDGVPASGIFTFQTRYSDGNDAIGDVNGGKGGMVGGCIWLDENF